MTGKKLGRCIVLQCYKGKIPRFARNDGREGMTEGKIPRFARNDDGSGHYDESGTTYDLAGLMTRQPVRLPVHKAGRKAGMQALPKHHRRSSSRINVLMSFVNMHICRVFTYLLINLFSVALPLAFSFHPRIKFYREWRHLFPAIGVMGAFFLVWDHYFTKWGVWSFNPKYVMGIYLAGMPVEEWMFFLFIPYSCLFIYHCLNLFFGHRKWDRAAPVISWAVIIICIGLMTISWNRFYTFATSFFLAVFILMMMIYRHSHWMGRFYRAYLVSKIPFLIVNGLLTALPVVLYNNKENTGLRIFTIPVEDAFYSMLMLMMTTAVYEWLKNRKLKRETV